MSKNVCISLLALLEPGGRASVKLLRAPTFLIVWVCVDACLCLCVFLPRSECENLAELQMPTSHTWPPPLVYKAAVKEIKSESFSNAFVAFRLTFLKKIRSPELMKLDAPGQINACWSRRSSSASPGAGHNRGPSLTLYLCLHHNKCCEGPKDNVNCSAHGDSASC